MICEVLGKRRLSVVGQANWCDSTSPLMCEVRRASHIWNMSYDFIKKFWKRDEMSKIPSQEINITIFETK